MSWSRWKAPVALLTQAALLFGTFPMRTARADTAPEAPRAAETATPSAPATTASPTEATVPVPATSATTAPPTTDDAESTRRNSRERDPVAPASGLPTHALSPSSLPAGGDKTGVSSQSISVPQGAGKVQGMGESFSTQMSTGVASFSVPFAIPDARGAAQPSLSLSYSSGSGHGLAGVGWDIGVPFIARQTDRGLPKYDDHAAWHPEQDRFVFNGGQELVPICSVTGTTCAGALANEVFPTTLTGWQYFRARVEGSYLRFFWSPDHRTWVVQSKSGETMELGVPRNAASDASALETNPSRTSQIFRWNLTRQYDAQTDANGAPVNVVAYRYMASGATSYVSDIYATPPAAGGPSAALSAYAQHVHLAYEPRPDATSSYRRGWRIDLTQRLLGVDVASKTFVGGAGAPRALVRRYHLAYDPAAHVSLLATVQLEGRCSGDERQAPTEDASSGQLPSATSCPRLPAMTFAYQHVAPFRTDGSPGVADLPGYEGFDERVTAMPQSPNFSVDENLTDLFDINSDGLPDVLVTNPAIFNGAHGVFFNGGNGRANAFRASTIGVQGVLGATAASITLTNDNVAASDIDGDGTIDLLHMPKVKTYSVYTPKLVGGAWMWQGRAIPTADQQDARIDFGQDAPDIRVMDVNGDGLVDVVRMTGTETQTFFALGRYPGGDAQYGSATWSGPASASISNAPVARCVPWAGTPVRFSDSDIKLADMNGDGLADIVRVHQGDIRYWPGRGNGFWGTGALDDCPGGSFGQGRDIAMANGPQYSDPNGSGVRLDDVNGDGLDDLVQIRFDAVDVWLNVDGVGFTPSRHVIASTPAAPGFTNRVRLADMNGSGTRDILWGDGGAYKYIDLAGGQRPWVLTHVENGLGKTTDVEYTTSTALMLAAEAAGKEWTSKAPMPLHLVSRSTERDNLNIVGRPAGAYVTEYAYANPVYDGRQREFRGFKSAVAKRVGDTNSPTASTSTTFLLGECKDDEPAPGSASSRCAPDGRWADNAREALKGLPLTSETFDEGGVYLSTVHHTYRLRKLYTGSDGREVRVAFESASDSWAYDTALFVAAPASASPADVELELTVGAVTSDVAGAVALRAINGRAHTRSSSTVDPFGNATDQVAYGCVDGCVDADEATTSHTTPGRAAGDASGWLWRTVETWTKGTSDPAPRKHTYTDYDAFGNPIRSRADLSGTLALDRFHENASSAVAPAPPRASSDGNIVLGSQTYDPFGSVISQTAPNARCRNVVYDTDYAALAISETVFAGTATGACGGTALTAYAGYDRGLAAVVSVIDLHQERSSVAYDGFGRLASLTKPSASSVGALSALPSVLVTYDLATSQRPFSVVHTQTQDGASDADASYRNAYALADGFGRAIATFDQADPGAGDGGQWVVNGLTEYDNKGAARRAYLAWFWSGTDPSRYPLGIAPTTGYARQRYDAFGRQVQTYGLDGSVTLQSAYHAMSVDKWDAADLQPGPHQGTYASARQDGHGRAASMTERIHVGAALEAHETRTRYLSTGEPLVIARLRGNGESVVRWLRYDSLGRMVLNVEPNVTKGFNIDPSADASTMKAWRYAYDDNGDLVGTSDARGCGSNFHYDAAGRLVAEDYSPCTRAQADYSAPNLATGDGAEVFNRYDSADPAAPAVIDDCAINGSLLLGRLASVSDRASRAVTSFDGRGRVMCVAKQVAKPGAPSAAIATRFAPRWYTQVASYDGADRPVRASTGARVAENLAGGAGGQSFVATSYTKRGTVRTVGSSYGDLVTNVTRDADGLVGQIMYGDAASTTTSMSYDLRRRLSSVQTYRGPPPMWSAQPAAYAPAPNLGGAPTTLQLLLEDYDYSYDAVDNPTEIRDWRTPSEWPAGAQPVTRKMQYDDLYRVTRVDYQYSGGDDTWVSPFAAENAGGAGDARRAKPSPQVSFAKRVLSQSFGYDWLGNTARTDDDAKGFYDRSLGAITNGTAGAGPYQLKGASGGAAPRDGALTTAYDDAGNLTGLSVVRNANAPCLPAGALCSQRFAYEWDEVGRMSRARRWDGATLGAAQDALPAGAAVAELHYAYDGSDQRVVKTAIDAQANQLHTVYVFGSLELRRARFDGADYERTAVTESPYLFAHGVRLARLYWAANDVPTLSSGNLHVLLELPDHLGSSAFVIDRATGELVERSTYQAYGGAESDYRPERWAAYRDDYRFTGKEEDVEVGLQYFGKRYYAPLLGRWVSADPLTVHGLDADANPYAYVSGRVISARDPVGLQAVCPKNGICPPAVVEAQRLENARIRAANEERFGVLSTWLDDHPTTATVVGLVQFAGAFAFLAQDLSSLARSARATGPAPSTRSQKTAPTVASAPKPPAPPPAQSPANATPKLAPQPLSTPAAPPAPLAGSSGSTRALAQQRGRDFQQSVHDALGDSGPNTSPMTGQTAKGPVTTIPDRVKDAIVDVKDVKAISFTSQLQAQDDIARQKGTTFNLIISPRTQTITLPLQRAVQKSGGLIVQFDESTGRFSSVTFSGNKVVRE